MAAILIFGSSISVFADDVIVPNVFFDVLQLNGVNGKSTTIASFSGGSLQVWFELPIAGDYSDADITLYSSSSITSANINNRNLNVLYIGDNMYRIYGSITGSYPYYFYLNLTFSDDSGHVDFSSVRVNKNNSGLQYYINSSSIQLISNATIIDTKYKYNSGDSAVISYRADTANTPYSIFIAPVTNEFKGYDILTYHVSVRGGSVTSVISSNPNILISYCVSPVNGTGTTTYEIDITLDLRNFDRSGSYIPTVSIDGLCFASSTLVCSLSSCTGFVVSSLHGSAYFLSKLNNAISSVGDKVSSLGSSFDSSLSNLGSNISGYFSGLRQQLAEQFVSTSKQLSDQFVSISNQLTSLKNTLGSKLDQLIGSSSAAADQFNDNVNSASAAISDSNNVISSISKPDVDQIDIDVSSVVPSADIATYGNILTIPFQSNLILSIFVLSLTFSLVGFVVFGKR